MIIVSSLNRGDILADDLLLYRLDHSKSIIANIASIEMHDNLVIVANDTATTVSLNPLSCTLLPDELLQNAR